MYRKTLVIMAKEPRPGRVKTRLAADIGSLPAALWMRGQLRRIAGEAVSPRWTTVLAVAPDSALRSSLLPTLPRLAQGSGDLGTRMARLFRTLPAGPILIIGADIPGVRRSHISQAFGLLLRHHAVIGPATDGGYWAVGLDTRRRIPADLFRNVRWSSPHALADTLATLPLPAYLTELSDVDTAADLERLSN